MRSLLLIAVSLLVVVQGTQAQDEAAVKGQMNVVGISTIINALAPELIESMIGAEIEDISGRTRITLVGNIDYWLSNINVVDAMYESVDVDLPNYVEFDITKIKVIVTLDWDFQKSSFPWIPFGGGRAVCEVSNSDIVVGVTTGVTPDGQPTGSIDHMDVTLRDVDMTISGSWFSWLYNFLLWVFNGAVKSALETVIYEEVTVTLNEYLDELSASFPTTLPVTDNIVIDYSLTEAPEYVTDPTSVVVSLLGEFYDPDNYDQAPFPHTEFNEHEPIPRMGRVWLDQFMLNTFLYTAYKTDSIDIILRDGDPVDIGFGFNTLDWSLVIPQLFIRYPNRELQLEITAADQPLVEITEQHAELDFDLFITFHVEASGDPENPVFEEAFTLRVLGDAAMEASLLSTPEDTRLLLKLNRALFDISLESSNIGDFNVGVLNAFIQAVMNEIVIPMVNEYLDEGIELPQFEGLQYLNADIQFHTGFLAIDTDIAYTIPDDMRARVHRKLLQRRHGAIDGAVDDDDVPLTPDSADRS